MGGGLPPKPRGVPPLGFPPTLGAWALGGMVPSPLGAGSLPHTAHKGPPGQVDPRNPFGGPDTILINPRILPVTI